MLTPFGDDPEPYFSKRGLVNMQVPASYPRSAVFIGTMKDDNFFPRATGFVASYEEYGYSFWHLVTAEHVVSGMSEKKEEMFLRANFRNGRSGTLQLQYDEWYFHPDEQITTDVAVCPLHPEWVPSAGSESVVLDHLAVPLNGDDSMTPQVQMFEENTISIGEDVCIVGLFRNHYGRERNFPIARVGNISMLDGDPVKTHYRGFMDAYLVEARSIGGLSGSPVFVSALEKKKFGFRKFYLLGLMHGHFDIADLNSDTVVDSTGGGINSGIGVVIPTRYIIETLCHPDLSAKRKEAAMALRKRDGATPDLAPAAERSEAKLGENPKHLEDFNRLVSAASKQKPKDGQT